LGFGFGFDSVFGCLCCSFAGASSTPHKATNSTVRIKLIANSTRVRVCKGRILSGGSDGSDKAAWRRAVSDSWCSGDRTWWQWCQLCQWWHSSGDCASATMLYSRKHTEKRSFVCSFLKCFRSFSDSRFVCCRFFGRVRFPCHASRCAGAKVLLLTSRLWCQKNSAGWYAFSSIWSWRIWTNSFKNTAFVFGTNGNSIGYLRLQGKRKWVSSFNFTLSCLSKSQANFIWSISLRIATQKSRLSLDTLNWKNQKFHFSISPANFTSEPLFLAYEHFF
jgi:hypothetical protein